MYVIWFFNFYLSIFLKNSRIFDLVHKSILNNVFKPDDELAERPNDFENVGDQDLNGFCLLVQEASGNYIL
jgi:hypothetical protein